MTLCDMYPNTKHGNEIVALIGILARTQGIGLIVLVDRNKVKLSVQATTAPGVTV